MILCNNLIDKRMDYGKDLSVIFEETLLAKLSVIINKDNILNITK